MLCSTIFDGRRVHGRGVTGAAGGVRGTGHRFGVLVEGGRIASIEAEDDLRGGFPEAVVHDYGFATLTPGLIDTHVHATLPGDGTPYEISVHRPAADRFRTALINLRTHLESGVTCVRDLGSHADFLDWRPQEPLVLPRLLRYGPPVTAPDGHMRFFVENGAGELPAREVVERRAGAGADGIKLVASGGSTQGTVPSQASLSTEFMREVVDAAHERGLLVTTHALANESIERAVLAGSDGIEHVSFLDHRGASRVDERIVELAVRNGVAFGTTLAVNAPYVALAAAGLADPADLDAQVEKFAYFVRNVARLHELGATLVVGTDAGWKYTKFGGFVNELRLLVRAGVTAVRALAMATSGAARHLGLHDSIGEISPGKSADLAVFDGNATVDIERISACRAVYRSGKRVFGMES